MPIKFISIPFVFILILSSCSDSSSPQKVLALSDVYQEQPGDVYTEIFTLNIVFSNGQSTTVSSIDVKQYSQASSIPSKYNFSNPDSGPFLLETTNSDGILDNLEYMSITGDFIIDDNLEYFTNVESTTENGSEDPENIYLGDKFKYSKVSKLFNSQTSLEEGGYIENIDFTVLNEEEVIVPAGTFNSVKISYNISITNTLNNFVDTTSGTGFGWFDSSNGILLKIIMDGDITLGEQAISATYTSESILQNYLISAPITSKVTASIAAGKILPKYNISKLYIFKTLKQNLNKVH